MFGVHRHMDFQSLILRKIHLAHGGDAAQLGDGVYAIAHQFPDEDIPIRIEPTFNDGEDIFTVNLNLSHFLCHDISSFNL